MSSAARLSANQKNARLSTGPRTAEGKLRVSTNATRHGLFSKHLLIDGESREELDSLLSTLALELAPVGLVESLLVERIAVAMWRQARMVKAESAELMLRRTLKLESAKQEVLESMGPVAQSPEVKRMLAAIENGHDAGPTDEQLEAARERWVLALKEIDALPAEPAWDNWMPTETECRRDVERMASAAGCSAPQWLAIEAEASLKKVAQHMVRYCDEALETRHLRLMMDLLREAVTVPQAPDTTARYQSALDNDLYKALRQLHDQQTRRKEEAGLVD